ncbi:MAG TPA: hypothetical protein VM510_14600 [Caulifigura sp.]|jgi:hypothetical protein|nr:hypothetical protein [Caulifigura sp.]
MEHYIEYAMFMSASRWIQCQLDRIDDDGHWPVKFLDDFLEALNIHEEFVIRHEIEDGSAELKRSIDVWPHELQVAFDEDNEDRFNVLHEEWEQTYSSRKDQRDAIDALFDIGPVEPLLLRYGGRSVLPEIVFGRTHFIAETWHAVGALLCLHVAKNGCLRLHGFQYRDLDRLKVRLTQECMSIKGILEKVLRNRSSAEEKWFIEDNCGEEPVLDSTPPDGTNGAEIATEGLQSGGPDERDENNYCPGILAADETSDQEAVAPTSTFPVEEQDAWLSSEATEDRPGNRKKKGPHFHEIAWRHLEKMDLTEATVEDQIAEILKTFRKKVGPDAIRQYKSRTLKDRKAMEARSPQSTIDR